MGLSIGSSSPCSTLEPQLSPLTMRRIGLLKRLQLPIDLVTSSLRPIWELRRIRTMFDLKTASTIATSIVHAKSGYCNYLFLHRPKLILYRRHPNKSPHAIQNAPARAVTKTHKHGHITPVLKPHHWLKMPKSNQ